MSRLKTWRLSEVSDKGVGSSAGVAGEGASKKALTPLPVSVLSLALTKADLSMTVRAEVGASPFSRGGASKPRRLSKGSKLPGGRSVEDPGLLAVQEPGLKPEALTCGRATTGAESGVAARRVACVETITGAASGVIARGRTSALVRDSPGSEAA